MSQLFANNPRICGNKSSQTSLFLVNCEISSSRLKVCLQSTGFEKHYVIYYIMTNILYSQSVLPQGNRQIVRTSNV